MQLSRRRFMASAAAATLVPAGFAVTNKVHASAPTVGKQAPGFYRVKLGEFELTTVHDGILKFAKPENLVVNKSFDEVGKAFDAAFIPRDNFRIPFTPTLVNTGKNLVLIDSGFGDNGPPPTGGLMSNLTAAGIDPKA
ncbi:MAG: MBL fold metallo-hydrolase, partial [Rhizobiales bacterium]|nr:MBL fold metallo-hydrolase [Hyphomicrobiales bacterium]